MRNIAKNIDDRLPDGFGFVVLAFPFGDLEGSEIIYASNANREDIVKVMKEWIAKTQLNFGNDTNKF